MFIFLPVASLRIRLDRGSVGCCCCSQVLTCKFLCRAGPGSGGGGRSVLCLTVSAAANSKELNEDASKSCFEHYFEHSIFEFSKHLLF